jgi:hypothetical protein
MGHIMPIDDAKVLDNIPLSLSEQQFFTAIRIEDASSFAAAARELLERAKPRARPKALYKVCFIDKRSKDTMVIEGFRFSSRVLSRNLREVERVFAYIATCGKELDELQIPSEDLLACFWLDTLKDLVLTRAVEHLEDTLAQRYGLHPEGFSTMNPGSGNRNVWPINQQKQLFDMLGDVEALIGVTLTESFLMLPNKTVSGIFFPTEVRFESCQLCTRKNCPRRRSAYTGTVDPAR